MSLKIRFRFDGRCNVHPRYNPESDGRPQHKHCDGCESLLRDLSLYRNSTQEGRVRGRVNRASRRSTRGRIGLLGDGR